MEGLCSLAKSIPVELIGAEPVALWIFEVHEPAMLPLGLLLQHSGTSELVDFLCGLHVPLIQATNQPKLLTSSRDSV